MRLDAALLGRPGILGSSRRAGGRRRAAPVELLGCARYQLPPAASSAYAPDDLADATPTRPRLLNPCRLRRLLPSLSLLLISLCSCSSVASPRCRWPRIQKSPPPWVVHGPLFVWGGPGGGGLWFPITVPPDPPFAPRKGIRCRAKEAAGCAVAHRRLRRPGQMPTCYAGEKITLLAGRHSECSAISPPLRSA